MSDLVSSVGKCLLALEEILGDALEARLRAQQRRAASRSRIVDAIAQDVRQSASRLAQQQASVAQQLLRSSSLAHSSTGDQAAVDFHTALHHLQNDFENGE